MDATDKAARIVRTVVETLKPGFAVKLWTGERIGPATGPVLTVNDPDIVWQMVRRPSFSTLIEMWISKAVDVEDGSLFDFYALPSQGKLRSKLKTLPKLAILPAGRAVFKEADDGADRSLGAQSLRQRFEPGSDPASL